MAAPAYRTATSEELNSKLILAIHRKLGKAGPFRQTNWRVNWTTSGTYVFIEGEDDFANGKAMESFQFLVDHEQALLVGWNVNSPVLITN